VLVLDRLGTFSSRRSSTWLARNSTN
jgi:hypothetical protein